MGRSVGRERLMITHLHLVAGTGARDSPAPVGEDAPVRIGVVSETGRREDNQDFAGASLGKIGRAHV